MQTANIDIQTCPQHKIVRLDDTFTQQCSYLQVHSQNFIFSQYDKGNKHEKFQYQITKDLYKYYLKRKFLFSRFGEGIKLDRESWFSVIPQAVSMYLRKRFLDDGYRKIFEPFSGVGGIAVHLCDGFDQYIVNDIDRNKINMLKSNMKVYEKLPHNVKAYCSDFLQIQPFSTDLLIICPPWGGIDTLAYSSENIDELMTPTLTDIFNHAMKFSENIMLQLPKNTNIKNLLSIVHKCKINPVFTIQKIMTNEKTSQLFIYFGEPKFTHINNSSMYNQMYTDLSIVEKKLKIKVKKLFVQDPEKLMAQIYRATKPKNNHIFFN